MSMDSQARVWRKGRCHGSRWLEKTPGGNSAHGTLRGPDGARSLGTSGRNRPVALRQNHRKPVNTFSRCVSAPIRQKAA